MEILKIDCYSSLEVPISPALTTKKALSIQVRLNYFTLHADIISENFTIKKWEKKIIRFKKA